MHEDHSLLPAGLMDEDECMISDVSTKWLIRRDSSDSTDRDSAPALQAPTGRRTIS